MFLLLISYSSFCVLSPSCYKFSYCFQCSQLSEKTRFRSDVLCVDIKLDWLTDFILISLTFLCSSWHSGYLSGEICNQSIADFIISKHFSSDKCIITHSLTTGLLPSLTTQSLLNDSHYTLTLVTCDNAAVAVTDSILRMCKCENAI